MAHFYGFFFPSYRFHLLRFNISPIHLILAFFSKILLHLIECRPLPLVSVSCVISVTLFASSFVSVAEISAISSKISCWDLDHSISFCCPSASFADFPVDELVTSLAYNNSFTIVTNSRLTTLKHNLLVVRSSNDSFWKHTKIDKNFDVMFTTKLE